jgi:hypothetical protein
MLADRRLQFELDVGNFLSGHFRTSYRVLRWAGILTLVGVG